MKPATGGVEKGRRDMSGVDFRGRDHMGRKRSHTNHMIPVTSIQGTGEEQDGDGGKKNFPSTLRGFG